jgi:hypothetical protein
VTDKVLQNRCRSGRYQRVHRGVYADFTGPLPWETRVWAAWLFYGPRAALAGETALRRLGVDGEWNDTVIELDIPHDRRPDVIPGIKLNRCRDFDGRLLGSREPAIVRLEVAVLAVASRRQRADRAISVVLDVCRQRRTTAQRLRDELRRSIRLPRRELLLGVLADASSGVQSFLEMCYLRRVERAHGLPLGSRQARDIADGRAVYRDVAYEPYGVIVELDGSTGHADTDGRWRDMHRDNTSALGTRVTLRFGYQVAGEPCPAALLIGSVLQSRGWPGAPTPCSPTCPASGTPATGEGSTPESAHNPPQSLQGARHDQVGR